MNVCLVHGTVTKETGSGRYIFDLATRFVEDGHTATLLCHECDDELETVAGLEILRIDRPKGHFGLWRFGHLLELCVNRRAVRSRLSGRHFDALIGSDLMFLKPMRDCYGRSLRFIYTPLSMIAPIEIKSYRFGGLREAVGVRLYHWLQRWALMSCDRVVRFTAPAVHALEQYYDLDLREKSLVSVYVSREFEDSESEAAADAGVDFARPKPRELIWIGKLIKSKNVPFILRAAAQLQSTDWVLKICSSGPERARLGQLASELGIAHRTEFLGNVSDLAVQYKRASLLLTGSLHEQYSLTLMEAYSFGVPCLGLKPDWKTGFNSNEEQIAQGVTGYVVRDEAEMAAKIDYLLAHEDVRQQMAAAAYAVKQRGFRFESFYADLKSCIRPAAGTSSLAGASGDLAPASDARSLL